ncbi:MAG: serine hydrolase [Planctomycetaceae bacterium]|nr:serine hydrolase [Planctomycetaceae bacterium]
MHTLWNSMGWILLGLSAAPVGAGSPHAFPQDAQPQDHASAPDRERRVEWLFENMRDSGVTTAVLVARIAGEDVVARGFGEIAGRPAGPDVHVPAGAATELLLAASVVHAAAKAEVDLRRPIAELLPKRDLKGLDVSLHQLLSHTSGLAQIPTSRPQAASADGQEGDGAQEAESGEETAAADPEWLGWLRDAPRLADPDTCFAWTNADPMLAELWLVDTTGMDARAYARKHLLSRLSITPPADESGDPERGDPESWAPLEVHLGRSVHPETHVPEHLAGVGLELTPRDLVGLLGALERRAILDEEGSQRMLDDVRLASGETTGHGYGHAITWLDRTPGRALGGTFQGTSMRLAHYPTLDLEVAVVVRGGTRSAAAWERALTRVLLDLPQADAVDLPLTEEERAQLTGEYRIGCDRLSVLLMDNRLQLRTPREEIALAYLGGGVFTALDGSDVRLEFRFGSDGRAVEFLLETDGRHSLARRFD